MNKKTSPSKRIVSSLGMILLALLIALFVFIGINGIRAGSNMPIYNNDQRDLSFFVSLYYATSIIAFLVAIPLSALLIVQLTQTIKDKISN